MIREIALVTENPETHRELVERLRATGLQVLLRPSLAEALPLFDDTGLSAAALILDSPRHYDPDLLARLAVHNPQLPQLLFDFRAFGDGENQSLLSDREHQGLARPHTLHTFDLALADADSFRLIHGALGRALGQAIEDIAEEAIQPNSGELEPAPARNAGQGRVRDKYAFLHSEDFLRRVGSAHVPVLLHGETGVGKEVMARRLWSYSDRAGKPFLKLNCAALPSELIESELFGYEKGAFTGATMDKPGKFELAQNGTILLDEIGDMDIRLQAKLLQVLQDGEVQPLGSSRILSVNVRVMAATHRDLRHAIREGSFREDLYYRLSVINITIPPLRERRHEILSLAEHLLLRHVPEGTRAPAIGEPLQQAMLAYHWPGNVRELENVMRRFLVYQDAELLAEELAEASRSMKQPTAVANLADFTPGWTAFPSAGTAGAAENAGPNTGSNTKIDYLAEASRQAESKLLLETLDAVRWNRRQAAARLNIDYKAFLYKLQKHGIVENKTKRRDVGA